MGENVVSQILLCTHCLFSGVLLTQRKDYEIYFYVIEYSNDETFLIKWYHLFSSNSKDEEVS